MLAGWLLVMLACGWSSWCIALGIYALTLKHTKLWVAILIKTLAVLVLLYWLYEGVATTLTLLGVGVRRPASSVRQAS